MDQLTLRRTVLFTGSRTWTDAKTIFQVLRSLDMILFPGKRDSHQARFWITVMHGACPKGADAIVDDIATRMGLNVKRYPADWEKHGKRAGYVRNQQMVDLKPDLCIAFIHDNSKGASMTADLAEGAGIRTIRYYRGDAMVSTARRKPERAPRGTAVRFRPSPQPRKV